MNTHKVFNFAIAFVFAFSLLGVPAPVSAQWPEPNPYLMVYVTNYRIDAHDWPPGLTATLTIDRPGTPQSPDYTTAQLIGPTPWDPNENGTSFDLNGAYHYQVGDLITVSDGTHTKTHIVSNIAVTLVDPIAETVSGTSDPGAEIEVFTPGGYRRTTTDDSGQWIVNFAVPWNDQGTFDLVPGFNASAQRYDDDGDATLAPWRVPDPYIVANITGNWIHASEWPLDTVLTLTIDDPNTSQLVDYTSQATVGHSPWNPSDSIDTFADFDLQGFDIQPGNIITASGNGQSKTLTVSQLTVTGFDSQIDIVSGTGAAGDRIQICANIPNRCVTRYVTADGSGNWTANYAVPGVPPDDSDTFDVQPGSNGWAADYDADSDATWADWNVPNPRFSVQFPWNEVHGYEWPLGAHITLTVDDPSNGEGADYSQTKTVDTENFRPPSDTWIGFRLEDFVVKPGDIVTMTDGNTIKTHVTQELSVTNVDPQADTVSGTATAGTDVQFGGVCDDNGCVYRRVPVDTNGDWLADFSVPGDENNEQETFDLRPGSSGEAQRTDDDGDGTVYQWKILKPFIIVRPEEDSVFGNDWPLGALLELEIDDPETSQSPDYTASHVFVGSDNWDNGFELEGIFDIQPGHLVTVSDENTIKQHTVTHLAVTDIDIDADTVSGTGYPGSEIHVGTICDQNSCASRNIIVNGGGNWLVDFSVPGDESRENSGVFDLRLGSGSGAYEIDEDDDATAVSWNVPNFTFGARPMDDSIEGWQWPLGATITIEIDDPATTETVDYSAQTDVYVPEWNLNETRFDLNFNGAYDLKPGDTVKVTDGIMIKTLVVTNFALVEINPNTDMVFGHASPNNQINVWACDNNGCVNREETSDQSGNWQTNFSIPGDLDWEQDTIDIQAGTWVDSSQYDEDNDETMYSRTAGSTITGTVYLIDAAPENTVAGVMIEACTTDNFCRTGLTDGSGNYWISGLPAGTYTLRAIPPGTNLPGSLGPVDISYDEILYSQDITIPAPPLPPPPDAIEPSHTGGGTLAVYWMDDLTLTTTGCINGTAAFKLTALEDGYTINGVMTETPVGSGTYKATIPPLYPHHGVTEIVYTLSCPNGDTVETPFFIYIDPSGVVKNTLGVLIPNATVTLLYADNLDGPFTEVPNDSTIMSPSNRDNPDTTNANGEFGWDVVAGFYKVRAEKGGCFSPTDPTQTFVESAVLTIPPPVTNLELILTCSSLPPSASAGGPYSINEGDTVTLDASASSDPEAGALTYAWDLDNDSEYDDATGVTTVKTYTDNGVFTIGLRVTDPDNLSATDTAEITVANVSPVVNIQQASVSSLGILTGNGSFADPGTDVWTASVKYGDGAGSQTLALNPDKSFLLNHTYSASGVYTIEVCVSDDDGGSSCNQTQVTVVTNRPPVAKAGGPYVAFEGTAVTLNASKSTDPDHNISRYEWDLDNDGQFDDATGVKPEVTFPDNGIYIVRVRVTDAGGLSSVDRSTATVKNVPPAITSLSFNSPVRVGVKVNANATFKDVGVNDTFTATWKWGDGTNANGVINGHTVTGSHAYARPGIYIVTIIVKDKDGGTSSYFGVVIVLPKK